MNSEKDESFRDERVKRLVAANVSHEWSINEKERMDYYVANAAEWEKKNAESDS